MVDTYTYTVVITEGGHLLVNGVPVGSPSRLANDDSEGLLAWALESTQAQHDALGGIMRLTVRDLRQGGYGERTTAIHPDGIVDLASLRRAAGRVYQPLTLVVDDAAEEHVTASSAPASPEPQASTTTPATQEPPSESAPSPAAKGHYAVDSETTPELVRGPDPKDAEADRQPTGHTDRESMPAPMIAREEGPTPPVEGWVLATPAVPRPQRPVSERRRRSVPRWVKITVPVAAVAVATGAVAATTLLRPEAYAKVCVDSRIDQRVPDDAWCDAGSEHFDWWYAPEGAAVPAVGGTPDQGAGTLDPPSHDAPVSTGFVETGGIVPAPQD